MSKIKIDKGVPLPAARRWAGKKRSFWRDADVGDSVFFDDEKTAANAQSNSEMRRDGYRFARRREGNGFRVWLIARPEK